MEVPCAACGAVLRVKPREQAAKACPVCGRELAAGAVLCVGCGFDVKTGAIVGTSVEAGEAPSALWGEEQDEEEDEDEVPPCASARLLGFIGEWMPGLLRPLVIILSGVVGLVGLGLMVFGLGLFGLGAVFAALATMAIGLIVYAQAVAWLLDGELCWLAEALTNLEGGRWGLFFALLAAPILLGFLLIHLAMTAG